MLCSKYRGLRIRTTQVHHRLKSMHTTQIKAERIQSKLTCNQLAEKAAQDARAKGWNTWTMYDQSDVLDWATTVAQKPGTNWYFIGRWIEDDYVVFKVQGDHQAVLELWLDYCNAY